MVWRPRLLLHAQAVPFSFWKRIRRLVAAPRSAELTLPGFVHDVCSAVHPLAAGSPFFKSLPLERFGFALDSAGNSARASIRRRHGSLPLSRCGFYCGFVRTGQAQLLQADEAAGSRLGKAFRRVSPGDAASAASSIALAKFGMRALCPTTLLANLFFKSNPARALSPESLRIPFCHSNRTFIGVWVRAWQCRTRRRLADSEPRLTNNFERARRVSSGTRREIETNCKIDNLEQLAEARAVLFDTSCGISSGSLEINCRTHTGGGCRSFDRAWNFQNRLRAFAAIPWRSDKCRRAGTIHLGGTLEENRCRRTRHCPRQTARASIRARGTAKFV